jgi:NTP pyrophosphatase (non-canonical NTP hydrolase)
MEWKVDLTEHNVLASLQVNSQAWREHSFPTEHRTAPLQALGVCEEAGELAHAVLKMEQGIRGDRIQHMSEAADAVGDIVIYLAGLCTSLGLDLETCVRETWRGVAERDWSKHKGDGVSTQLPAEGQPQ